MASSARMAGPRLGSAAPPSSASRVSSLADAVAGGEAGAAPPGGGTAEVLVEGDAAACQLVREAVSELLRPVDDPRWLLSCGDELFAVPRRLGTSAARAEALRVAWAAHVGPAEVCTTREPQGRRLLLAARARHRPLRPLDAFECWR